jgi:hypothetical protein
VFKFNLCFLNGEGAGLGDPGFINENLGPFKSFSILSATGASLRSGRSFWVEFSASCTAAVTMYSLPVWKTIEAFTAILAALLSHSMKAAKRVLLVG